MTGMRRYEKRPAMLQVLVEAAQPGVNGPVLVRRMGAEVGNFRRRKVDVERTESLQKRNRVVDRTWRIQLTLIHVHGWK